jgi:hypothetical protein
MTTPKLSLEGIDPEQRRSENTWLDCRKKPDFDDVMVFGFPQHTYGGFTPT